QKTCQTAASIKPNTDCLNGAKSVPNRIASVAFREGRRDVEPQCKRVQGSGFSIFVNAESLMLSEELETDILNIHNR
ncbi:MAG TPA: hypothetical protein VJ783_16190, partial [Pirellulales bacterium]|nr:hypothetical protein [Pirellulales bacterium]